MRLILNILWLLFGGFEMALGWWVAALFFAISIIGLPWARAAFNIGLYTLWPFGQEAVRRDAHLGREDIGTGLMGAIGNVIWFVLAGWWLALGHLFIGLFWAITIIGLPFAWVHFKLIPISAAPIGMMIVPIED
ncbi:MAG: YccF domain-containing protein [Alphaproteobacteria bacterium]|nr:MAG: YccF domain-containing protein [Alphaproteobacteria bacterium]